MTHLENSLVRRKREGVSQSRLRELLTYDPETGVFANRSPRGSRAKAGGTAGFLDKRSGYWRIRIDGVAYEAHRLAWLYMTGSWPYMIDHKDHDRTNNRWGNLREATAYQNMMNRKVAKNNTSGFKGVSRTPSGRWLAQIRVHKKPIRLGLFDTPEQAAEAYITAAAEHYGEFAHA